MSVTTLRRWEAAGKLTAEHTAGGHRRYDLAKLKPEMFRAEADAQRRTVAYARVSSHDQKDDLERQKQVLERYCARQGWTFEVIADLGSGMNYRPETPAGRDHRRANRAAGHHPQGQTAALWRGTGVRHL